MAPQTVEPKEKKLERFYELLHARGMTLGKLAAAIGNKSHARLSQAIAEVPGRGRDIRRRLVVLNLLTREEMAVLGWDDFVGTGDRGQETDGEKCEVTAASDNVLMWRLGEACETASERRDVGDLIDRGLILLELLNEKGFTVFVERKPC